MLLHGILLALMAGLAIPLGAFCAHRTVFEKSWNKHEVRHAIIGLGAGALVAAVALVLIPEGAHKQPAYSAVLTFVGGGVFFMLVDKALDQMRGGFSQFLAMMLDFVPEAIVLGALLTQNLGQAVFLAIVIAAQNFPEGYAAYLDLKKSKTPPKHLMRMFTIVGISGPVYILLGTEVFEHMDLILGMMMTFCAGGILYLVFEDVAPRVSMKNHWLPPLGTVAGFTIGLIGYLYA